MFHPTLRIHDGFDGTSPELRGAVKQLQELLNQDGFPIEVDGLFGRNTESAVKRFQREQSLDDDGIVGPLTWAALLGVEPSWTTTFATDDPARVAELAELQHYLSFVCVSAARHDVPFAILAGIGSRESGWGLRLRPRGPGGTGDFLARRYPTRFRSGPLPPDGGGFGRGLLQIDFDAHAFARSGAWSDPAANIDYGARVLANARSILGSGSRLSGNRLLRAAIAAYNSGVGNVLNAIKAGLDLDYFTAGRNYSSDVLNRAGWFHEHEPKDEVAVVDASGESFRSQVGA
jgi:hypothetical protein